jgi:hypothetical protein
MYQEEVCVYCAKLYGNEINEIMSLRWMRANSAYPWLHFLQSTYIYKTSVDISILVTNDAR